MGESKQILGLKDVLLMSFFANLGIRWLPIAAGIGPSTLLFWFLGALLFFLPFSLIVSELSTLYPEKGGMYVWIKKGLGPAPAFVSAWCYWVVNFFYYPAILTFLASNLAYAIMRPALANNEVYVTVVVIVAMWMLTFLLLGGLKTGRFLNEKGGIVGTLIPVIFLIFLGFGSWIFTHHTATSFSPESLLPSQGLMANLSVLSILMFAMAGMEVIPTFASSVRNPARNLPRGVLLATLLIFLCYTLGTVAMNLIASPNQIQNTTGIMSTFALIDLRFHIPWLTEIMAWLLSFAEIAALSMWLIAPPVMFFQCTEKHLIPQWLHRNNKNDMPYNALILQAVLVTVIVLVTALLPSVNDMYQVMVLMTTAVYFIPYVLLIVAYVRIKARGEVGAFKVPGHKGGAYFVSATVFLSLILGIALCFVPGSNLTTHHALVTYETELIAGPIILVLVGMGFYWRRRFRYQEHSGIKRRI